MVMAETAKRSPISVGFYDIIRTIGKGNFASVKLARHRITKTEVAIKIIEKSRLDQSNLEKIYREIQILKLLRHQHIMKLYEVIETKTTIYLVCEYASHGEVFDYITQEERIPEEKAKKMFYQVVTAIEYCHKNNVVHRDLKAENLLLDANDNIKLADFGFGNFFQSGQTLNTWCGSPPYAAPEVFEGKLYEGPQLDIWSLGIVLYVLVCGTFPFDGSNLASLKERVLAGRFRIPYWMSQDCENLIRRMLVVNPKKRLTIAQIKKHKWMQEYTSKAEFDFRSPNSPIRRSGNNPLPEYNEYTMKVIQSLGIDTQQTIESLQNSSYNNLYAIYHLLLDRSKHHRTSVPLDTKFSYDGGKRRPSNLAEQSLVKPVNVAGNPTSLPKDLKRNQRKNLFYANQQQHVVPMAVDHDDVTHGEVSSPNDVKFVEDVPSGLPTVHRTLALGFLQNSHMTQVPVVSTSGKPRFFTQPKVPLPRQPWSFNAGDGGLPVPLMHARGSGDVIPSVSSIDEGVELASAGPSEQEMVKHQQRRHTLGIPHPGLCAHTPFTPLVPTNEGLPSGVMQGSQVDSLFSSTIASTVNDPDSFTGSLEMAYDVNQLQGFTSDGTPRLVVSPCLEESTDEVDLPQDPRVTHIENQRQLLDVSPTGFRQGRRASDGLLLLGDNRIGEHLKRLTRATGCPTINQEDNDDNCFEATVRDTENQLQQYQKFIPVIRNAELGTMMSHSSHHVMQGPRGDTINFQPYTSTNRRRSFQVMRYIEEGRSGSYSKDLEVPSPQYAHVNHLSAFQPTAQSYEQSSEAELHYQWSSWKTVTENEPPNSSGIDTNQRRDTIPLLMRHTGNAFAVASDESMARYRTIEQAKRQPSLPNAITTGHQFVAHQSLVQQLQQRRFTRRLKMAQNSLQSSPAYHPLPLSELQGLRINVDGNFTSPNFSNSNEDISARLFPHQSPFQQYASTDVMRTDSPELQQIFHPEASGIYPHSPRMDPHSPLALINNTVMPLTLMSDRSDSTSTYANFEYYSKLT